MATTGLGMGAELARLKVRETRLLEWMVEQGLLHYYPFCKRPDGTNGPAWVVRKVYMVQGDSCEAWHATSAAGALEKWLEEKLIE